MKTSASAALRVRSLGDPLSDAAKAELAQALPEYVAGRRWYRAKTRTIERIDIDDVIRLEGTDAHVLVLTIRYSGADTDRYVLAVSIAPAESEGGQEVIATLLSESGEQAILYDALTDGAFREALLEAIVCEKRLEGRNGLINAARTAALREKCGASIASSLESFVSRAEQSNTSIIYRDRYILKLFRKLESGVSPDAEIGLFLTRRGFKNTPAVLGTLEYREQESGHSYGAAILQEFVPNKGDAWKYTLECLESFFDRALTSKRTPPKLATEHPLTLIGQEIPPKLRMLIGHYLESAAVLGRRTAEMHAALADPDGGADFKPEPFTAHDAQRLNEDLVSHAKSVFQIIREKQSALSGVVAIDAQKLLEAEDLITERLSAVQNRPITAVRIRHHGDYHLGQVLYTGQDFVIIDFEGEPARTLAERRAKALAMRDVAGMIRSFQYAAFAALFGQVPGIPNRPELKPLIEGWAAAWTAFVSSTYLTAYFEHSGKRSFVPASWQERRTLLDAFLLQKALYEVAYELNNRPDWLQIPLRGILSLIA
jgi:trehalose synthase-fused probable maltokinase